MPYNSRTLKLFLFFPRECSRWRCAALCLRSHISNRRSGGRTEFSMADGSGVIISITGPRRLDIPLVSPGMLTVGDSRRSLIYISRGLPLPYCGQNINIEIVDSIFYVSKFPHGSKELLGELYRVFTALTR